MTDTRAIRIGDAERDAAVAALGEHYSAGRLTKEEYDERSGQVWAARYQDDLAPLFTDLPGRPAPEPVVAAWRPGQRVERSGPQAWGRPPLWAFPLALLGVAAVVSMAVLIGPWILFGLFWLVACGGFGRRNSAHWRGRPAPGPRPGWR